MTENKATTGQLSDSAAEVYENFFVPALFGQWPDRVMSAGEVIEGDDVLDVGCGTGVLARAAARRLAGTGSVTGLDVNDGMLAAARRASEPVTWVAAPAERLPFADASFDRVMSQFALMFFTDPRAALTEMARVARPHATVTVATWASLDDTPGYAVMVDLLQRLFGDDAAAALRAPYCLGTERSLLDLVEPEFETVTVNRHAGQAVFESLDAWIHTDVRGWTLADMIDDEQYAELVAAAPTELARFVGSDGRVSFEAPALIGTARAR